MSSPAKAISLRVSAIIHATEDSRKVEKAIRNVCQLDEPTDLTVSRAKGHHGNQITTLTLTVTNHKAVEHFLQDFWNRLTVLDKDAVFSSLASRVDTSRTMYLRISKQEALKGVIRLNDSDPIKVAISFSIFGPRNDGAVNEIQKFLTELSTDSVGPH